MLFNCSMRIKIEVKIMVRCKLCHIFYFGISFPSCLPVVHISHIYITSSLLYYIMVSASLIHASLILFRFIIWFFQNVPILYSWYLAVPWPENFLVLIRMYRFIYNIEQVWHFWQYITDCKSALFTVETAWIHNCLNTIKYKF